jgi:beta-glucuronidase
MTKSKTQIKSKYPIPNIKTGVLLFGIWILVFIWNLSFGICHLYSQDVGTSSGGLIDKAWQAHGARNVEETLKYTQEVIDRYKEEADAQQASLKALPKGQDEIAAVSSLNDVAAAYFIRAEIYMRQEDNAEAKKAFQLIIDKYPYAQSWDQRGWFWQLAEAARQSIKKIETGSIELDKKRKVSQLVTKVVLYDAGDDLPVNYAKYGEFKDPGTKDYRYIIKDQEGLSAAAGEGIYPNTTSARWDPEFKKAVKDKARWESGTYWDFVHSPDLEAAFLKWATSSEPQGVKLFYTGLMLEKSGLISQALKCYYAIIVHFPGSYGWTYWRTPWYIGQAAVAKIERLLRDNPQLGLKLVDADVKILNGYDNDVSNDIPVVNPGRFVKVGLLEKLKPKADTSLLSIKRRLGKGKVHLVQYATKDWQLIVDGKPYVIKGVTYAPTKVGQSPDEGTLGNWMDEDFNKNGSADGPYEAFVDRNGNGLKDKNEPAVGDFRLMKMMGVNTLRLYHHTRINKPLLRELYQKFGIRVIIGDFLGKYAIGSGASWNPGTDYNDPQQRKKMLESVAAMAREFKDEPFVLFWLLGNENVYGYACNADKDPQAFYRFANEAALAIKAIDKEHPVGICNGDVLYLNAYAKNAPDIDIFGANSYRGDYGFGRLWKGVREETDKPVFITEYGCPAYAEGKTLLQGEELQAAYHRAAWEDMAGNMAFAAGSGNSLGGVVFEWLDEWWKQYESKIHDTKGVAMGPFPDGYFHEEWFGLCGQADGSSSPFLRHLRKSYFMYKKLWDK